MTESPAAEKPAAKKPRTKRTKPAKKTVVVAVLGAIAVVVGALWGFDTWLRQQVADYVTDKVEQVLSLDSDQPVTVNIAGFSMIAQVLTGTLEQVDVGVDDVTLGDFTGGVRLTAEGIPVDLSKPIERVQIEFSVSEKSVESIAHLLSASAIDNVELVGDEIQFKSELGLFGFTFEVGAGVEPFAANGEIGFTPSSVSLNDTRLSVEDLISTYGSIAEPLFASRSVCIARWLPVVLSLDAVEVRDDANLVITIGADKRVFDDASLRKLGHCPTGVAR